MTLNRSVLTTLFTLIVYCKLLSSNIRTCTPVLSLSFRPYVIGLFYLYVCILGAVRKARHSTCCCCCYYYCFYMCISLLCFLPSLAVALIFLLLLLLLSSSLLSLMCKVCSFSSTTNCPIDGQMVNNVTMILLTTQ